jgi:hypothetical protein
MKNKRTVNVIVFALTVIALLLRPYFAYQLIENQNLTKDPAVVNSLLQRLIKKKDDHHSVSVEDFLAIRCAENKTAPPLRQYTAINKLIFPDCILPSVFNSWQLNTIFQVYPHPKYYRLLSSFKSDYQFSG